MQNHANFLLYIFSEAIYEYIYIYIYIYIYTQLYTSHGKHKVESICSVWCQVDLPLEITKKIPPYLRTICPIEQ